MSTNWKIGDKAVCVDASPSKISNETLLVIGTIYLVTDVWVSRYDNVTVLLLVAGVSLPYNMAGNPTGWTCSRFRKVITRTERAEIEQETRV